MSYLFIFLLVLFIPFTTGRTRYTVEDTNTLPYGTYFLGPGTQDYGRVFAYYYYVYSTNPDYYERSVLGGTKTYNLVPVLHEAYINAGASNFVTSSSFTKYPTKVSQLGYSSISLGNMPNNATLYLLINANSRMANGSTYYDQTLMNCISSRSHPYFCLNQDQLDMIGQLNDMTNIKLPKVFYISNGWVILGIFTITIVTLLICSFIFGFLMEYRNKKNTQ